MNIGHVIPTYLPATRYGGPIRAVHDLCRYLVMRGHRVDVFTTNVDGSDRISCRTANTSNIDGVNVHYFPVQTPHRLYYSPRLADEMNRRVVEFDILHLHSAFLYPTLKAARCAARNQIPYVISPRGMLVKNLVKKKNFLLKSAWISLFERRTVEQAAALHVTSALEASEIRKFGFALPALIEIANGVEAPTGEQSVPRESNTVLFLGRLDWKKGIERLISAVALVANARLIIAGNDEVGYTPKLKALARQLEVLDRVKFVGPVDGVKKWRLYRQASVFVLPSLSENLANTVLEAMAMECPVVVTPEVGLADVVERHGTGVVSDGTPANLATAIGAILGEPKAGRAMGKKGREIVEEKFAWNDIAAAMDRAYLNILDKHESRVVA